MKPKYPTKYIAFTTYFSNMHEAVDIPNGVTVNNKIQDNKNVYMTHEGKVITNSYASDYGYFVEYEYIGDDGAKYIVGDGHFNNKSSLEVGKTYPQGTFINTMGNSGSSTATHDHHRLTRNGIRVNPLNYEYVYPDQVVGQYETAKLMYYKPDSDFKYRAHVQGEGWLDWVNVGEIAGTTGKFKRLEGIQIDAPKYEIYAKAHCQGDNGWRDYGKINKNTIIGTEKQAKRLEAIQLKLPSSLKWRVHMEGTGWSCWTKGDGVITLGSMGLSQRIEAIQFEEVK